MLFLGMCESLRKDFFPFEDNVQGTCNKGGNLGDHYCWTPASLGQNLINLKKETLLTLLGKGNFDWEDNFDWARKLFGIKNFD